MEIRIQSVKFDAGQKLLDFVNKKVEKIEKFHDGIIKAEVTLSLLPDNANKEAKIRVFIPGNDVFVTRNAKTFEDAVVDCVAVIKGQLVRKKEKQSKNNITA
ncbi:MAG: HPF/RaiA family ribosome-associated protein [Bacteroidales bacterium]|jgi:ribosomal subunit interface protein|nr:HPF/RaiA family ribosome-associated protein [Bacteroidales bacterium]